VVGERDEFPLFAGEVLVAFPALDVGFADSDLLRELVLGERVVLAEPRDPASEGVWHPCHSPPI